MRSDIAVSLTGVSKVYPVRGNGSQLFWDVLTHGKPKIRPTGYRALTDINLEIIQGETVGIVGKNGSGKSTLLQIICGTLPQSEGKVSVTGKIAALLELGAGFNPDFTGIENAKLAASILGMTPEEIDSKLPEIVEFADIGEFIHAPVRTYSSGMYVRLGFAVIANVNADILIIDEALAVGDVFFTQKCMRFLREFMKQGTVIFVSHDGGTIANLCSRAVWLEQGKVRKIGNAKEVADAYFASGYGNNLIVPSKSPGEKSQSPEIDPPGIRETKVAGSSLDQTIKIFEFSPTNSSYFGKGGVSVESILLSDANNQQVLSTVSGQPIVTLRIVILANSDLQFPIVGFSLKDRLGQPLFGENTFIKTQGNSVYVKEGSYLTASFTFRMPTLPVGDYMFTVAVAHGTQAHHEQLLWLTDALPIRSLSSSVSTGLVGIPMHQIDLTTENSKPMV